MPSSTGSPSRFAGPQRNRTGNVMEGSVDGLQAHLKGARRNVFLLASVQAILGSAPPLAFALGGLAGYQMLGEDKSLATAPLTGFNVGVALGAVAVAIASRFLGRQAGFMLGALMGAAGSAVAAIALFRSDFWLFAVGLLLIGVSGGLDRKSTRLNSSH